MKDLNELFDVIKFTPFIEKYTDTKATSGIRHRKTGKGTQANDKKTSFTDEDIQSIKAGLIGLKTDIDKVVELL